MKKLRIGIVGCGGISGAHIEAYSKNNDCEVVSCADNYHGKARAKGEKHKTAWYKEPARMYGEEELDAISVCTPPGTHKHVVMEALEEKINVLCEKPLSLNSAEAMEMAACARKNRVLLLVANCHIFHPPVMRLAEIIESGGIGRITSYRNRFNWAHKEPGDARIRGGALLDNGIHSIYLFQHLVGDITRVASFFEPAIIDITGLRRIYAMIESRTGIPGIIEIDAFCSSAVAGGAVIEVFGEKGSAVVNYSGESFYMSENEDGRVSLYADKDAPNRFEGEINHFVRCVMGKEQPVIDAVEGVTALKVAEKIFQAGTKNLTVEIDV